MSGYRFEGLQKTIAEPSEGTITQMNVSTLSAITVVFLVFYVGARYRTQLFRKKISPRIATWMIFEVGVVMSLASYSAGNDRSLMKTALNAADSFQVTIILIALVIEQRGVGFTSPGVSGSRWGSHA